MVINFHGGGFTLGAATDDRRWAGLVLRETNAIVVSVEYRLAPEFSFPIAVEDGYEALLHLAGNSQRYGIDPDHMAISGFSAGANMVFTVPLKLHDYISKAKDENNSSGIPPFKIVSLISFYPLLDFQEARASKREGCKRPDKTLAPVLTTLFDSSYMPNMDNAKSPFASPSTAPEHMLSEALPAANIGLYCCEWDMLHAEGLAFSKRLIAIGKEVQYETIPEVPHAFDKAPNPFGVDPKAEEIYQKACGVLNKAFGSELHPLPLL